MKTEFQEKETARTNGKINEAGRLDDIFDAHIAREFADRDVDATMETMVPEPYVHCVPIMTGGAGAQGVPRFYSEHFIRRKSSEASHRHHRGGTRRSLQEALGRLIAGR